MEPYMYYLCSGTVVLGGLLIAALGMIIWFKDRVLVKARPVPIKDVRFGRATVQGVVERPENGCLKAPISRRDCVLFNTSVIYIPQGEEIGLTKVLYDELKVGDLKINDGTGRMRVSPQGRIEIRLKRLIEKDVGGRSDAIPGFVDFADRNGIELDRSKFFAKTYRVIEECLEPGTEILVIGQARKHSGPHEGMDSPYLIESGIGPKERLLISDSLSGRMSSKGKVTAIISLVLGTAVMLFGAFILLTRYI